MRVEDETNIISIAKVLSEDSDDDNQGEYDLADNEGGEENQVMLDDIE